MEDEGPDVGTEELLRRVLLHVLEAQLRELLRAAEGRAHGREGPRIRTTDHGPPAADRKRTAGSGTQRNIISGS